MRSGCKKALALLLAIVLAVTTAACGAPAKKAENNYPTPENPVTIKWGMENQAAINAQRLADYVKEATDGAVLLEIYPNGQLGTGPAMWEGVLSGTLDMTNALSSIMAGTIPEFEIFSLPFGFYNPETFWNVVGQEEFLERFTEKTAEKNVVLLGITTVLSRGIVTKEPVTLPEDIRGMNIRISGGHTAVDMYSSWGAGTTIVSLNEVYTALQQGVVDGLDLDAAGCVDQKFFEQAPYFLDTFHSLTCSPGVMRADLWNSLSPDQQQAFRDGYKLLAEDAVETYYHEMEVTTQRALDMGVTFTHLTPEQKQVWIDAVSWMYSDYPYIDSDFESWFIDFVEANKVESARG